MNTLESTPPGVRALGNVVLAVAPAGRAAGGGSPIRDSSARARDAGRGPSDDRLPQPGTRIGAYEIIRELGRGGMGAVFLARDTKLGRRVAIKFLLSEKPELNVRFILEARATAKCNHENIIVIHDADEHAGLPYMVLEYLQGTPLSKHVRGGQTLPPKRALEIAIGIARALVRAHELNIVHRDLKPDNIFLTDSGTIKVLDFGIAKLVQEEADPAGEAPQFPPTATAIAELAGGDLSNPSTPELTRRGALVGTLPYMSPEQWGADVVDHRTDLWAVGILLFRMIAGKHPLAPLAGPSLMVTGVVAEPMPPARHVCPEMPDAIARVIDRCLMKRKAQRWDSARQLLDALEAASGGHSTGQMRIDEAPYTGLRAFQEADHQRFFGRSREIAAVTTKLAGQPLIGVVGPSGVGKSSFVRAGLVPALKHSEPWNTLVIRPGRHPVAALAQAVAPLLTQTSTTVSGDLTEYSALHRRLYDEPGYFGVILRSRARREGHKLLVFIDQFEELYTLIPDPRERHAFTRCLASAADDATSPLRVVISIRSDFLDRVPEDQHFMAELSQGLFFLTPPNRAGLRDAVIEPALMAGYQFEDQAIVEHMLDHLEHVPGALPLLQFAATKLWELRDPQARLLTRASYDALGGIAGALASHADATLAEIPPARQSIVRAVCTRLVTPERTRAVVPMDELYELSRNPAEVQAVIDALVAARLLIVQASGGVRSVEIVHESLIQSWPTLRRWLDETQDDAAFLDQLRNAAKQWQARNYAQDRLWRGEAEQEARRWSSRYRGTLPDLQRAFLSATFALATRSARRRRVFMASAYAVLIVITAAAVIALLVIRDQQRATARQAEAAEVARQQARDAESQVRAQLEQTEAEVARRQAAERQVRTALTELQAAHARIGDANRALESSNGKLQAALRRAKRLAVKARKAREEAEASELVALRAKREAELEKNNAQAMLKSLLKQVEALNLADIITVDEIKKD